MNEPNEDGPMTPADHKNLCDQYRRRAEVAEQGEKKLAAALREAAVRMRNTAGQTTDDTASFALLAYASEIDNLLATASI